MSRFVVISKYSFPLDAHIAKASLESEGIPAYIADEHTINMQWLYFDALGNVRFVRLGYTCWRSLKLKQRLS